MSKIDDAEGIMILGAGVVAIFVAYKVYKTGADTVKNIAKTASDTVDAVKDAAKTAVKATQIAYAEVKTTLTGTQYYSPSQLDASMSRADAIKLADQIAKRDAIDSGAQAQVDSGVDAMGNGIMYVPPGETYTSIGVAKTGGWAVIDTNAGWDS